MVLAHSLTSQEYYGGARSACALSAYHTAWRLWLFELLVLLVLLELESGPRAVRCLESAVQLEITLPRVGSSLETRLTRQ